MIPAEMLTLATRLYLQLARFLYEDRGQGLTEYALILTLIAVVAVAALTLFGGKVTDVLSSVGRSVIPAALYGARGLWSNVAGTGWESTGMTSSSSPRRPLRTAPSSSSEPDQGV